MAVTIGTNAGFVSAAPSADPEGSTGWVCDGHAQAVKDTSPSGSNNLTEIGYYVSGATEETNFEVALYSHNAVDDKPNARIDGSYDDTNAKGSTAGWKSSGALEYELAASTTYWIAVQIDVTSSATRIDYTTLSGQRDSSYVASELESSWGAGSSENSYYQAIYALYEASGGSSIIPAVMHHLNQHWRA